MLRSIGSPGMGGCAIWPQPVQIRLRRIVRMTLNIAVTRASCSDTSSPSNCMALLHFGQIGIGLELVLFAWQMRRQGFLAGMLQTRPSSMHESRARRTSATPLPGRQILELGFEPIDLPLQLLGLTTEVHPPELVDLRFQAFDFAGPVRQSPGRVRRSPAASLRSMPAARAPGRGARQRCQEAAHDRACAAVYEPSMRFTTSTMRPCDGAVANRCLPATSTAVPTSERSCRHPPGAK